MQPAPTLPMVDTPATIIVPEVDDKVRAARQARIKSAWAAYRGEFKPPFLEDDGRTPAQDSVIVNRCGPAVKVSVDFLFGKDVHMTVIGKVAQVYLDKFWKANRQKKLLKRWATNGAIAGHAWLRIIPDDGDEAWPWPRIVVLDPMHVDVVTDPDDVDVVLAYVIQYQTGAADKTITKRTTIARNDPYSDNMVYGWDGAERWLIVNQVKFGVSPGAKWELESIVPWDWKFPPIIDCQNMCNPVEYLGEPDLTEDIISTNNAINFITSNISRIIKFYAHPQTWGYGFTASQLDRTPGGVIVINDPQGKLQNLEMHSNLDSSEKFLADLRADMDEETGVPEVALGRQQAIPRVISGVALELLYQTLLQKTTSKQCYYGDALELLCSSVLEMAGFGANMEVTLHWPNLLPPDDLATAQALTALVGIGLSEQTALEEAGYDPDDEQKKNLQAAKVKSDAFGRGEGPPPLGMVQAPMQPTQGQQNAQNNQGGNV